MFHMVAYASIGSLSHATLHCSPAMRMSSDCRVQVWKIGMNMDGSVLKIRASTSGCCEQVNIGPLARPADGNMNGTMAFAILSIQKMDGGSYRGFMTSGVWYVVANTTIF